MTRFLFDDPPEDMARRAGMPITGDRPVVSLGVVKQVLGVLGGDPISSLPDLLLGALLQPPGGSRTR